MALDYIMERKLTRSARLKKYESVYREYIKNKSRSKTPRKKERKKEKKEEKAPPVDTSRGKKRLTEYQKFVKKESKKEKYQGLKPDERLAKIARAWKKITNLKTAE